jgi:hypothetical protein
VKVTRTSRGRLATIVFVASAVFGGAAPALATSILGSAESVAILGASQVTNTGPSTVVGDIDVSPGSAITGLSSVTLSGAINATNAISQQAAWDAAEAYTYLNGLSFTAALTGQDLGTLPVLAPGVYKFASSAQLTGTLTLDFDNLSNQSFVFQIATTLITAAGANIVVLNGDASDSIFFTVGSSATIGTATQFAGNILANKDITLTTSAQITCGRALALTGAVTMDTNRVSNDCTNGGDLGSGRSDFGSAGFSGVTSEVAAPTPVSEPTSVALLGAALLGLGACASRRRVS